MVTPLPRTRPMSLGGPTLSPFETGLNSVQSYLAPRSNMLLGVGAGLLSGDLGNVPLMAMEGRKLDSAYAEAEQAKTERQKAIQDTQALRAKYSEFFRQQNEPELADLVANDQGPAPGDLYWKWRDMKASGADGGMADLGLSPQYGVDQSGNPVLLQMSKNGKVVQSQMPDGISLSKEPIRLDAGTHYVLLDPITRQPVGQVEKDLRNAGFETGFGTASGKAAADRIAALPQAIATSENMLGTIDGILNDPALDASTGWLAWMQNIPGTDQYRFGQRALQLQGQAFLQAFQSLRGGGQISNVEGEKATQAIGRLSTAQSPDDYRAALNDLRLIVETAKQRAISGAIPGAPMASPPSSDVDAILNGLGL